MNVVNFTIRADIHMLLQQYIAGLHTQHKHSKAKHSIAQWLKVRIRNRPFHTCRWKRTQKRKLFDVSSSKWQEQQVGMKLYETTLKLNKNGTNGRVRECNRHYMKSVYPFISLSLSQLLTD